MPDETPNSVYYLFNITLDEGMKDGEYEYILVKNPNSVEININVNDIFESTLKEGDTLIESKGLIVIGNDSSKIVYNKETDYIVYGS